MKKVVLLFVLIVVAAFSVITGCKKNSSPASPATTVDYSAFVSIRGDIFIQTDGTNSFAHEISPFYIGKYKVTYDLWYTVYQWAINNGYTFANAGTEGSGGIAGAAPTAAKYEPVTTVNWRDAIVWCNAYSQKSGLTPIYCTDQSFATPITFSTNGSYSFDNPSVNWSANGYRLPTEGEWQYAASYIDGTNWTPYDCASGTTTAYTSTTATALVAWYSANSVGTTHDVGGKMANTLGIYDMSGNAWEWCWDWYGAYPTVISTDYRGPATGSYRILRGGSFNFVAYYLQVGHRNSGYTYSASNDFGFRLARTN